MFHICRYEKSKGGLKRGNNWTRKYKNDKRLIKGETETRTDWDTKISIKPKICIGEYGIEYKLRREEKGNENRL